MAARATPKVSPQRGTPVEDWVAAKAKGWQAEAVGRLLALARRVAPEASVSIKWAQPVIESNGPAAFIKVATAHVTFGFWRGAALRDPKGLLGGGAQMKHLKIKSLEALDEKTAERFLAEAIALNRKLGDPTKR